MPNFTLKKIVIMLRCLDEWDVFLDETSRAVLEKTLIEHAASCCYQYIFISPQAPSVDNNAKVKVISIEGTRS